MDRTILDNLKKWRDKKNKKPLIILSLIHI